MRWSFGLTNTTKTILIYLRIDVCKTKQKRRTSNEAPKKWLLNTHFYKLGTFCRLIVSWCFFCDLQRSEPVEWRNGKGDRVCSHFASKSVHLRQLRSSSSSRAREDSSSSGWEEGKHWRALTKLCQDCICIKFRIWISLKRSVTVWVITMETVHVNISFRVNVKVNDLWSKSRSYLLKLSFELETIRLWRLRLRDWNKQFSFQGNYGAASLWKGNTQIWYKTSW